MAVDCVGVQPVDHLNHIFHLSSSTEQSVCVSTLKRAGHARFRRGPSSSSLYSSSSMDTHGPLTSSQSDTKLSDSNKSATETTSSTSSSSMTSSLAGSVSNGKSLGVIAPAPTFSSRKPPLPSTHRKRCVADRPVASVHSCKRRRTGSKREVRRVPIIGSKVTSIPADDYSWKKYGEKKIEGSAYPRVYYKCSTGKGCPARKSVELAKDNSKMLLVTYAGEHCHRVAPTPVPAGLTGAVV